MNAKVLSLVTVLTLAVSAPALADAVLLPGAWEMVMKVTARNPETGETKTLANTTTKLCMSQSFVDKNPYLTPSIDKDKAAKRGATCALSDEKKSKNAASWTMKCTLQNGTRTEAHINNTASAKEMRSEIKQDVTQDGHTIPTVVLTTGKHIGTCGPDMTSL